MQTLRAVVESMGHLLAPFKTGSDEHEQKCPKCRLTALLEEAEKVDLVQKWRENARIIREKIANGKESGCLMLLTAIEWKEDADNWKARADELAAWLAVNLERIKEQQKSIGMEQVREAIAYQIRNIPQGNDFGANRYDSEHVHHLHLWRDGKRYDISIPINTDGWNKEVWEAELERIKAEARLEEHKRVCRSCINSLTSLCARGRELEGQGRVFEEGR